MRSLLQITTGSGTCAAAELVVETPVTFEWVDINNFTLTYTGEHPQKTARLLEIINVDGRVFAEGHYNPELDATCIVVTIKQEQR